MLRSLKPSVDLDQPVARQHERAYSNYYGWPYYWGPGMTGVWGMGMYPFPPSISPPKAQPVEVVRYNGKGGPC